jgi:hypothetical protein
MVSSLYPYMDKDTLQSSLDLKLEFAVVITYHTPVPVSHVSCLQLMVLFFCLLDRLIALTIQTCVELLSALSCTDHMDDGIVASIAQQRNIDVHIIQ